MVWSFLRVSAKGISSAKRLVCSDVCVASSFAVRNRMCMASHTLRNKLNPEYLSRYFIDIMSLSTSVERIDEARENEHAIR